MSMMLNRLQKPAPIDRTTILSGAKFMPLAGRTAAVRAFDARPMLAGILDSGFIEYDMAVCGIINPQHQPKTAVYGCAGADISNFLLATDATTAYFVDLSPVYPDLLHDMLSDKFELTDGAFNYCTVKYERGFGYTSDLMRDIETKIAIELNALGIKQETLKVRTGNDGTIKLTFEWAYAGREPRTYTIVYVCANIERPETYPNILKEALKNGVDIYYERASLFSGCSYYKYLVAMASCIKPGGYVLVDDTSLIKRWVDELKAYTGLTRVNSPFLERLKVAHMSCPGSYSAMLPGYGWASQPYRKE